MNKIYSTAKIIGEPIMGDNVQIDDYTFINCGKHLEIGDYTHICSFTSIVGGGELIIGKYVAITCGVRIITATCLLDCGTHAVSTVNDNEKEIKIEKNIIEDDVFIGANAVIYPGIIIAKGTYIGANSVVTKNTKPWGVYYGSPAKFIRERKH